MTRQTLDPIESSAAQVRRERTTRQGLCGPADAASLTGVVRGVCGINAQRSAAMELALRARIAGLRREDIDEPVRAGGLVRAWTLRGTIHLHEACDLRWLVPVLGPVFNASAKRRRDGLGLTEDVLARGTGLLVEALAGSEPLTRWELMDALSGCGLKLDRKSQAPIHLIRYAALAGLVAIGPDRRNGEPTYGLFDRLVGKRSRESRKSGLKKLARRYLEGYGPATPGDFAAWSGLPAADARTGWGQLAEAGSLLETRVGGKALWSLGPPLAGKARARVSCVRLLPAFDSYLLGYSDRELVVPTDRLKDVYHGGQVAPSILVDGAIAGVWRYEHKGKRLLIEVQPFEPLDERTMHSVSAEASDVSRFFSSTLSLVVR
jgi:hypothetical protein